MDELYMYIKKKQRKTRVQTAVDREKIRITAFEVAPRQSSVLRKLIDKIGENNLKIVCTDGNFSYDKDLGMNADIMHAVSKSETCVVESYNLVLRYYLARLHSKSIQMLERSIALVLHSRMPLC